MLRRRHAPATGAGSVQHLVLRVGLDLGKCLLVDGRKEADGSMENWDSRPSDRAGQNGVDEEDQTGLVIVVDKTGCITSAKVTEGGRVP